MTKAMDILHFLKNRTQFIRQYYNSSAQPFFETMEKIEAEEEPYVPRYSEDAEPAFLSEWIQAKECLEVLGRCCISLLSESLKLYFKTWERELYLDCRTYVGKSFTNGFVKGYGTCFAERLGLNWQASPVDLAIIEQVVMARNLGQHPDNITTMRVEYSRDFLAKHRHPFFLSDSEVGLLNDIDFSNQFSMLPNLHITREKLFAAIAQVELLCEWLEEKMFDAKYPHRKIRRDEEPTGYAPQ